MCKKNAFPEVAPEVKMSSENNSRWSFCSSKNSQDAMKYIWDSYIFSQKCDILRLLSLRKYKKGFTAKKVLAIMPLWANFCSNFFHRIYSCKLTYIHCCYILLQLCNFSWSQNYHMCSLWVQTTNSRIPNFPSFIFEPRLKQSLTWIV